METLETLGRKIRTAHDLLSVVKTMKSLAAVNIRQYEGAALAMNEYASVISTAWQAFFSHRPQLVNIKKKSESVIFVLGSDQGMCGQFNEAIINYALISSGEKKYGIESPLFWSAGERVRVGLEEEVQVDEHFSLPSSTGAIADLIFEIVDKLTELRQSRQIEKFIIFYNRLGRAGTYEQDFHLVLPLNQVEEGSDKQKKWPTRCFPMLGVEETILFEKLFQQHIFASIYKTFAQSIASENAARLAAMQAAEKNIREMEDNLQGKFRETRQNTITAELLDIISGFEIIAPQ